MEPAGLYVLTPEAGGSGLQIFILQLFCTDRFVKDPLVHLGALVVKDWSEKLVLFTF